MQVSFIVSEDYAFASVIQLLIHLWNPKSSASTLELKLFRIIITTAQIILDQLCTMCLGITLSGPSVSSVKQNYMFIRL